MPILPRISVITPSYNQGRFIGRTIDSVLAQGYPEVEHIVVDGMSTDDTPQILARYPHLRVLREPDRGQAEAINKGFRLATGAIQCFLNSDDTFLPGALHRVAQELDPKRGRQIIVGRCIYIDENDVPTGLEHPSGYESHRRLLEVWKVHCIPQPATFWLAEVWRRCGPMDENEQLALDYDLMCRFSRCYRFHEIDQVLATYRLHSASKSCSNAEQEIIDNAIRVSRRYWGSPFGLQYWRLRRSLAQHRSKKRRDRLQRAIGWTARGQLCWNRGQWLRALAHWTAGAILAPGVTARRWAKLRAPASEYHEPLTRAWRNFRGQHCDGTVGPEFLTTIDVKPEHTVLRIDGERVLPWLPQATVLQVLLDNQAVAHYQTARSRAFAVDVSLTDLVPGPHRLRILTRPTVVPYDFTGLEDMRPLGFRLKRLCLEETPAAPLQPAKRLAAAG